METHTTTYYEDETGAKVTDTCVTVGDSAYSTESITSVTTAVENPRRGKLIAVAVLSLAFVFFGWASGSHNWSVCGIILLILSGFAYYAMKPTWHLRVATTLGETSLLQSSNPQKISSIAHAIGEAIAHRF
jgi:predicted MFS family arabinose efflux permease